MRVKAIAGILVCQPANLSKLCLLLSVFLFDQTQNKIRLLFCFFFFGSWHFLWILLACPPNLFWSRLSLPVPDNVEISTFVIGVLLAICIGKNYMWAPSGGNHEYSFMIIPIVYQMLNKYLIKWREAEGGIKWTFQEAIHCIGNSQTTEKEIGR